MKSLLLFRSSFCTLFFNSQIIFQFCRSVSHWSQTHDYRSNWFYSFNFSTNAISSVTVRRLAHLLLIQLHIRSPLTFNIGHLWRITRAALSLSLSVIPPGKLASLSYFLSYSNSAIQFQLFTISRINSPCFLDVLKLVSSDSQLSKSTPNQNFIKNI